MADKKISQLTNVAPALTTDQLPINRGGVSGKLTVSEILVPEATLRANADGDLTTLTTTNKSNLVGALNEVNGGLSNKISTSYLDTDISLAANSDSKIATQKATKAYVLANTTPAATESIAGKAEIATQAETNTGTDDTRIVSPLKLKTYINSLGLLTGSGTSRSLPLYNTSTGLSNSAISQSTTGNRILVNGVTDDTSTTFQVSGSIRQTSITNTLAAYNANGVLVSGGSGNSGYISKFSGSGNFLGNSLIRDDNSTVAVNNAPIATSQFYVKSNSIFSAISGTNNFVSFSGNDISYGIVGNAGGPNTTQNIGILATAYNSLESNIAIKGEASTTNPNYNIGGYFRARQSTANYAVQLVDGTEASGKFLKSVTIDGKANWANITSSDIVGGIIGNTGSENKLAFYNSSKLLTYNSNFSIDTSYPSITIDAAGGNYGTITGYGFEARNTNGAYAALSTASDTENSILAFTRRRGNNITETPVQAGDLLGQILFTGNDNGVLIEALATETQTINSGSRLRFRTVRTGYTLADTKERLSIEGDGKVRINENYKLPDVDGAASDVMKTDGAGIASWGKVTSASTTGATNGTGITVSTGPTTSVTFYITNGLVTNITYQSW